MSVESVVSPSLRSEKLARSACNVRRSKSHFYSVQHLNDRGQWHPEPRKHKRIATTKKCLACTLSHRPNWEDLVSASFEHASMRIARALLDSNIVRVRDQKQQPPTASATYPSNTRPLIASVTHRALLNSLRIARPQSPFVVSAYDVIHASAKPLAQSDFLWPFAADDG